MTIHEATTVLKRVFGSYSATARFLGISPIHYRALRNGRVAMPKRTADFIILKAEQAAKESAQ